MGGEQVGRQRRRRHFDHDPDGHVRYRIAARPHFVRGFGEHPLEPRLELAPEDRALLQGFARDTWRYFEDFMGPEDNGLPADNFQEGPVERVAHRTSPTNIGMGLLSTLAAHDLGFISTDALLERLDEEHPECPAKTELRALLDRARSEER